MLKNGDGPFSRLKGVMVGLPRPVKRLVMIVVDSLGVLSAAVAAILVTTSSLASIAHFPWGVLLLIAALGVPLYWILGLYRAVVRYLRSRVIGSVVFGVTVLAASMAAYAALVPSSGVPLGAAPVFWAFAFIHTAGLRFMVRDFLHHGASRSERAIIYGAGTSGARLAGLLASGGECQPVAFVDDNVALHGSIVAGLYVHSPAGVMNLVRAHDASRLLLAIPSATRQRRAQIIDSLLETPLHIQTVPDMHDLVSGRASFDDLREVEVDDLLGRDPIPPRAALIGACVTGRNVMVTGAGGSIGSELCRQIVKLGAARLVLVDHAEPALYAIEQELQAIAGVKALPIEIVAVLGSVTESNFLRQIIRSFDVRTLYHAAAYKHVPLVEYNMGVGIRNNVLGTYRTAMAAERAGVDTFVLVSTDKAVNPTNVMGATKRFAEVILQGMVERGTRMRICMVRFGNVLASSGSVVPRFREQIRAGGPITVTHPEIERYFMTIPEAAQLVIEASAMGDAGDVFLLDMGKPVKIVDLARRMIQLTGLYVRDADNPDGDIEIVYTGLRPGEKLYEELLINGGAIGTDHPRIWRASDGAATWAGVRSAIEAITRAVVDNDCDAMRRVLLEVVPEYTPPPAFVDHLYAARAVEEEKGAAAREPTGEGEGEHEHAPVARLSASA
jgi:FlaA1/EpsC-like NDP-sugar epimerase